MPQGGVPWEKWNSILANKLSAYIRRGREPAELMRSADPPIDSKRLQELFDAEPWFKELYFRRLKSWPGQKLTLRLADALYPEWPEVLLRSLEEQFEAGQRPTLAAAVRELNSKHDIPVKVGWIYNRRKSDPDFDAEVGGFEMETSQRVRETLEHDLTSDTDEGSLSGARINYLRSIAGTGLSNRAEVDAKVTHHRIDEKRKTLTIELLSESQQLGQQLERKVLDVSSNGSDRPADGGDETDDRPREGSGEAGPEESREEEGLLEEVAGA